MRFLVGDTYTSSFSTDVSTAEVSELETSSSMEQPLGEVKKRKKRKRKEDGEMKKRSKKEKNDKKKKTKGQVDNSVSESINEVRPKKDKKRSKPDAITAGRDSDEARIVPEILAQSHMVPLKKNKKLKKEKKDREKKSKKEKTEIPDKTKRKGESNENGDVPENLSISEPISSSATAPSHDTTISVTNLDRSLPIPRHLHRARFLAMKRASVMDPNALREILGVSG